MQAGQELRRDYGGMLLVAYFLASAQLVFLYSPEFSLQVLY